MCSPGIMAHAAYANAGNAGVPALPGRTHGFAPTRRVRLHGNRAGAIPAYAGSSGRRAGRDEPVCSPGTTAHAACANAGNAGVPALPGRTRGFAPTGVRFAGKRTGRVACLRRIVRPAWRRGEPVCSPGIMAHAACANAGNAGVLCSARPGEHAGSPLPDARAFMATVLAPYLPTPDRPAGVDSGYGCKRTNHTFSCRDSGTLETCQRVRTGSGRFCSPPWVLPAYGNAGSGCEHN